MFKQHFQHLLVVGTVWRTVLDDWIGFQQITNNGVFPGFAAQVFDVLKYFQVVGVGQTITCNGLGISTPIGRHKCRVNG